ncbi:MAG: alpha/beta hydrolase [Planctomycetota bacterium]
MEDTEGQKDDAGSEPKPSRRRGPRLATARRTLLGLVAGYVVIVALAAGLQRKLMYPGGGYGDEMLVAAYADAVPHAEDVIVTTADGLTLHGWHVFADDAMTPGDRPTVLFFHGNGGHRAHRAWVYRLWTELGCDVIAFDYRGYGENEGSPSEAGLLEDARSMWRYATETAGLLPERIVLYGASLGGGAAIGLAHDLASDADAGNFPRGLVVRSTFSSMVDAATNQYPFLPVRWVLLDRYESAEKIASVECPVLMFHGDRDTSVPLKLGKKLFDAAPETSRTGVPKRFELIERAGHNDLLQVAGDRFTDTVRSWLDEIETRQSARPPSSSSI